MASFTDDFNRADSSDLGAGWVEVSGDWSIVSNQLSPGAAGGTIILRAADPMASDDHYAQVTIAATTAASQGVWCRGNTNLTSGYLWRNDGTSWDLFSVVGGSFTGIGSFAAAASPGDVAKVQAVGSTIKAFVNGVERVSLTNTHVTTGTSVGIRSESAALLRYDSFTGADVSANVSGTAAAVFGGLAGTAVGVRQAERSPPPRRGCAPSPEPRGWCSGRSPPPAATAPPPPSRRAPGTGSSTSSAKARRSTATNVSVTPKPVWTAANRSAAETTASCTARSTARPGEPAAAVLAKSASATTERR
jgi:hypothetical protein